MKLSDFLTDMVTKGTVKVEAKYLRQFAQQALGWEEVAKQQSITIDKQEAMIDRLRAKLALKELEEPVTIDLFA